MPKPPPEIDEDWGEDSEDTARAPKNPEFRLSPEDEMKRMLVEDLVQGASVEDLQRLVAFCKGTQEDRQKLALVANVSREELAAILELYRNNNKDAIAN